MPTSEDRLWLDGRIFTGREHVEAMLVENGRVAALGSRTEVLRKRPTGVEVERLEGRQVVPGLIDSHVHMVESLIRFGGVNLAGVSSWAEFESRVRSWTMAHPVGPVLGGGWDQERLPAPQWPYREFLDRLVPERPVHFDRVCEHVAAVNSVALEQAGIERQTPDPVGGRIGRTSSGEPNGLLFDNAIRLTREVRVRWGQNHRALFRTLTRKWASYGLTSVGAMSVRPTEWLLLEELQREEPLPVRLRGYVRLDRWKPKSFAAGRTVEPGRLSLGGVKAALDGALGSRTAWLEQPYADAPEETGFPLWGRDQLLEGLREARAEKFAIALHAIGDRALAMALDVVQELGNPPGTRIEHVSVATPDLLARLARSRASAVIQPLFRASDWWLVQRLGERRAALSYPFRAVYDAGVPMAASSDSPVETADPWPSIRTLLEPPRHGSAPGSFTPEEVLALYTVQGARALGMTEIGQLAEGSPADFVVLEAPTWEQAARAPSGPVRSTWSDGRATFAPAPTAPVPGGSA